MKFSLPLVFSILVLATSCSISKPDHNYSKIQLNFSRDSIVAMRKKIMDLPDSPFSKHHFDTKNGTAINYRLLRPALEIAKKSYPLIVVLHGSHAIGTDNTTQMGILAKLWSAPFNYSNYPAYVIALQFPSRSSNYVRDAGRKVLVSEPQACLNDTFELIDSLLKTLPINRKKIYVIGHSMGGSGVTNVIGLKPDLFAAGVAVSGIPNFSHLDALASTPLWLVHGNADTENPIETDILFFRELQKLKPKNVVFNEIEGMEHEIWPGLFFTDALPKWLFSQQRK